jgi:hypothetical protein
MGTSSRILARIGIAFDIACGIVLHPLLEALHQALQQPRERFDHAWKPGSAGDATILSVRNGRFDVGEHVTGEHNIASERVVIAGRWWHPKTSGAFKPS